MLVDLTVYPTSAASLLDLVVQVELLCFCCDVARPYSILRASHLFVAFRLLDLKYDLDPVFNLVKLSFKLPTYRLTDYIGVLELKYIHSQGTGLDRDTRGCPEGPSTTNQLAKPPNGSEHYNTHNTNNINYQARKFGVPTRGDFESIKTVLGCLQRSQKVTGPIQADGVATVYASIPCNL
ncbi:hypothetical protein B0H17DRAFT_1140181 [Mycena rosella]|uniref:Uncharacterized protein n=1 Tax=Mycena rosella TaxID=1033263 RepID=A0AAD7D2K2_MYCRO|nr:hypothetical protein B0H17DRAFT_1140181 [Mycena rosella]